jgi:hypothetical protein
VPGADRRALVVTTPSAAGAAVNGATLRAEEITGLLRSTGHDVVRAMPSELTRLRDEFDLGVAVSYACAGSVARLRRLAPRVWLDAVDSWLLVNGSGIRSGHPSYLLRAARDAARLVSMPRPHLVTYISAADLDGDRCTVRGGRHLVLPGRTPSQPPVTGTGSRRVVLAGDWRYPPNRDGLAWFRRRVLPALEQALPSADWSVTIYGTGLPPDRLGRLEQVGYVDDGSELYREGDVHVAPVRFGGGVKRKVLQPLLAGLPVVTTRAGAHGLRSHPLLDVCGHAGDFARAVADRLQALPARQPVAAADLLDADDSAAVTAWLRS